MFIPNSFWLNRDPNYAVTGSDSQRSVIDEVVTQIHNPSMRIPSLQTLRAFDAAGRHQSYSKAGQELGLTHSAVSHRIRELEALLGKHLFVRQGNRMTPTIEGARLLAQVRNVLGLLESIFPAAKGDGTLQVTIGVFPAMGRWLVSRLGPFRAANQDIDLRLDVASQVVELGRGVDSALRYGMGHWPGTESRLLAKEVLFPVCSPDYFRRHPVRKPEDLGRCHLLRHPWHSWAAWFHAAGVAAGEPSEGPEYTDSGLLTEAAAAGEGVALVRGLVAADGLRAGSLMQLFDVMLPDERAYYFVRPAGRNDERLDRLEAWLAGELRDAAEILRAKV